jgi:hypothetical protein
MIKRKHNTDYQCWKGNITKRLSMMKRKQNKKTINDEMETEQKDYQWSKGNRTKKTINDQKEIEQKTINDQKEIEQKTVNDQKETEQKD